MEKAKIQAEKRLKSVTTTMSAIHQRDTKSYRQRNAIAPTKRVENPLEMSLKSSHEILSTNSDQLLSLDKRPQNKPANILRTYNVKKSSNLLNQTGASAALKSFASLQKSGSHSSLLGISQLLNESSHNPKSSMILTSSNHHHNNDTAKNK